MTKFERIEFEEPFGDKEGGINFIYKEPCRDRDGSYYELREKVPPSIVEKGEEAILKYALCEVRKAKLRWRKKEQFEDDIIKNNIPIQVRYGDGITLEGRIVEAKTRFIRVELDKPIKGGQRQINFGFASAMVGHYVFDNYDISQAGYDASYGALIWVYEEVLNKPTKDLIERLNQR